MVADALKDVGIGVVLQLDRITLDKDEKPPPAPNILDSTRDAEFAADRVGPKWPALVVSQEAPASHTSVGGNLMRTATVVLSITYMTAEPDISQAIAHGLTTVRAVAMTMKELMRPANVAKRLRAGVEIVEFTDGDGALQQGQFVEELGDGIISAAATVSLTVKDTLPLP